MISDCITKLCHLVCCLTSLWTASLCLIHCTNTVLYIKHSRKGKKRKRKVWWLPLAERQHEQTLYTPDAPSVSRNIISEMSLPTHTLSTSPSGWCYRWFRRKSEIFQPSLLSPHAVPILICHGLFCIFCKLQQEWQTSSYNHVKGLILHFWK